MTDKLLAEVAAINKKYALINQKTGAYFNIFDIAGISTDELVICKVIGELLDFRGSHCQDDAFFRLFASEVLKLDFTELEYATARVHKEYGANRRRIDLMIITLNYMIPIEVKIFASDQDRQCSDYSRISKNSNLYYLTIDGRPPSENSADGLTPIIEDDEIKGYEGVRCISFGRDIINWLNKCLALPETIKIAPIREILLQFKDVLLNLTGNKEGGEKMEIVSSILSSPDAMKSALEIENAMPQAKTAVMKKAFSQLKRHFEESGNRIFDYDDDVYNDFYTSRTRVKPGFGMEVARLDSIALVFYVEIVWYMIYGFCFADDHTYLESAEVKKKYPQKHKELQSAVADVMGEGQIKDKNYIYCDYVTNDKAERFNFMKFSPSCVDLQFNGEEQIKRIYEVLYSRMKEVQTVCRMKREGKP